MPSQKYLDADKKKLARGPLKGTLKIRIKGVSEPFIVKDCETAFDAVSRLRIYHFSQLESAEQV